MAEKDEEKWKQWQVAQQTTQAAKPAVPVQPTAAPPTAAAPTTPGSPIPNQPAVGANLRLPQEQQRTGPRPERIKTAAEIQSSLPGLTVGQQTRGAGAVRLDQQTAPAGKELIGMRSGVPIYADAKDIYGVNTEAPVNVPKPANMAAGAAPTLENVAAQRNFFFDTAPKSRPVDGQATDQDKNQRLQQARDAYQTGATASAVRAQAAPAETGPKTFFRPSVERDREMEAARQRGLQRAAKQDAAAASLQRAREGAAVLYNEANRPKLATAQDIASYGFDAATQKRLSFGVGERGEPVEVTPQYLTDYAKSKGITKRPATSADRNIPVRGQTNTGQNTSLFRRPFFR